MAISIINITAEDRIKEIECHFKVSAGPGAGKTHWLINHIKNVVFNSTRLKNSRKIACITYTNVAVETILERLGPQNNRVEVSTIHSFLYKHILKPFAFLIPIEFELDIEKIDGHDDIPIYKGMIYEWKNNTNQVYIKDDNKIIEALNDLLWQLDSNGSIILKTKKPYTGKIGNYSIKKNSYIEYKKMYWRKGLLSHDDVLFFSYILINEKPRVLDVIKAKFPYFFIDEFQDTNPIQTYILKKLSENETIVGVIGDIAQSIYEFQGAVPDQFNNFILPGLKEYVILDNYRSTKKIVSILKIIRSDLNQFAKRNIEGITPKILVGNKSWALNKSNEIINGFVNSLSRDNITSNIMKENANYSISKINLIDKLRESDSNPQRAMIIIACIKAIEFARQNKYKESLKELIKELKKVKDEIDVKQTSLIILKKLICNYTEFKSNNCIEFYTYILTILPRNLKLAGLKTGSAKTFYENNTYEKIALSVNIKEESSLHRTIHKAKGAEFDHVLLILDKRDKFNNFQEIEELGFLFSPNLIENEEHRIRYVAVSRARDSLFINVPYLSIENENKLLKIGFEVIKKLDIS